MMMTSIRGNFLLKTRGGFSLVEVIMVTAIIAVLAGLVVSTGWASLRRSRVDAIALEMAGWLNGIHANTTSATSNVNVACEVTFAGSATYPNASEFKAGSTVFTVSNGSNSTDCSPTALSFKIPANAIGVYEIASPSPIKFNLRGNVLVGRASNANQNNMSGSSGSVQDIKIYMQGQKLLRCVRINYLLGTASIGANSNASAVKEATCEASTFGGFANEKF
jgi:prepilin-type N-terminal cleavage/methylation domain-containing protein